MGRVQGASGDQHRRPAVAQHIGQPLQGVAGVHGQKRRPGLEDAHQGGQEIPAPFQQQGHELVTLHPGPAQPVGDAVGPAVQCIVIKALVVMDQGGLSGVTAGLCLHQGGQGLAGVVQPFPPTQFQQLPALVGVGQGQFA